ncbi:MAG: hypothetical protein O8C66_10295 [Candidatus Methanoperedens sp.]|nr:hypothetical protein [Candidatus Methanoperedens sp.]MCZ7370887.1 hypothetical protein [Candidatus Methanoperedens sp.]
MELPENIAEFHGGRSMAIKAFRKRYALNAIFLILIFAASILISGCLQYKQAIEAQDKPQTQNKELIQIAPIEKISDELNLLQSKEWGRLAAKLGHPRATTLLWYHLRTTYSIDTKVIFGYPNKVNNANLAIMVITGGNSSFPNINIKGVNYYIIDPMTPAIINDFKDFKYGDIFDDPRNNYLSSYFGLYQEDASIIEQWNKETGVGIKYTDFPATVK